MINKNKKSKFLIHNSSGFLIADFLFSFILVLSCGIIIFAMTFSLATVEIAQYIVWSSARSYSAANKDRAASETAGIAKFRRLTAKYPLLTGVGDNGSPWFTLSGLDIGDSAHAGLEQVDTANINPSGSPEHRHPWTGARADLQLKLFESLQIPFIGKIATDTDVFKFQIRAFLLRNPSQKECLDFFKSENRFQQGIQKSEEDGWNALGGSYVGIEDNGC